MDVRHRMDIAQAAFGSLNHLWTDHRLSRETKLRLYRLAVCSSLTHCCTTWALTRTVRRMINGFNSRCLHVITGGLPRHGHHACVRPGVGCAEATNALPRPPVAPATGQDSTTFPRRSCEGRHVLSRGQPVQ